ncbi:hypothetical protein MTR_7g074135 [Medicago truncatula]|uniref:Uncharacterized protein n=1 Tax=Medicago truncatula TaxID=3880 RepID=A0A072U0T4_MEDTR|nr:hypothetical protein MTR_7g074135 [Medicago truncatula]
MCISFCFRNATEKASGWPLMATTVAYTISVKGNSIGLILLAGDIKLSMIGGFGYLT